MPRGYALSPAERDLILECIASRAPYKTIAHHFGLHPLTICQLALENGLRRHHMPPLQGPPLTKVTINLFSDDVEWFKKAYGLGWSARLREQIHNWKVTRERSPKHD